MEKKMKEYEALDKLLSRSRAIKEYFEERERMMFEIIRLNLNSDAKVLWLEGIGYEIGETEELLEKLKNERESMLRIEIT